MPNEKCTKDCRKRWYFRGFWSRCRVLQLGVITWFSLDEVRKAGKAAPFFFSFEIVVEAFADWQRGTCTFLTTLSLSAIATNGKIAGGGAYYLCLGMCLVIFSFRVQLVQRCYHVCVFRKLLNEMTLFFYAEDLSLFGSCVGGWSWSLLLHGHWAGMRHKAWNDPYTFIQ